MGSDSSGDSSGAGGYYGRGGVRVFRRPTRVVAGEAGKETGIFIPERMKRPGIQGKEPEIRAALKLLLSQLTMGGQAIPKYEPGGFAELSGPTAEDIVRRYYEMVRQQLAQEQR